MIAFGTGGWRAIIGEDFIRQNIQKVAWGIAQMAKKQGKTDKPIAIGYDRRFLSREAAEWVSEVLVANDLSVIFVNRSAPTPLIMHTVMKQGLHFGVEITASHNPSCYNGIKLIVEEGRDANVETTTELEALIAEAGEEIAIVPFAAALESGAVTYIKNPFNNFIDDIMALLDTEVIKERGPRILFDPMHGSGTYPLMVILFSARCTLDLVNANKDAYFGGGMPAPNKRGLRPLAERVEADGYHLGIALDGDGDRLGIIDSNGNYIDANQILVMLYYYLHEYKGWRGPVVRNVATTHMLDKVAKALGEECYEVPVGFKYISAGIDRYDAILGGESSGGLTVRGHIHGKDSIYAASLFVEMISAIGKTPSEFYRELEERFGTHFMVEDNLRFDPARKAEIYDTLITKQQLPTFAKEIARINCEDGCKVVFTDDSFVICRFSGTEPLLRIFAEAPTTAEAEDSIARVKAFLGL